MPVGGADLGVIVLCGEEGVRVGGWVCMAPLECKRAGQQELKPRAGAALPHATPHVQAPRLRFCSPPASGNLLLKAGLDLAGKS